MLKKHFILYVFVLTVFVGFSQKSASKSTANKQVQLLDTTFVVAGASSFNHKVWVYLPKNYAQNNKSYPVLYMQDGQNLFDKSTSYAGEWEVDESLDAIFDTTGRGFIVVGIENAHKDRINEYTPWAHEKYGGGQGDKYMNFLATSLKPYIDSRFRTKKSAKNTALIGSSLGGLISFYGGFEYPDVFGKIGAFSTSFWFSEKVGDFIKQKAKKSDVKLYLIVGKKEGYNMDVSNKEAYDLLLESGFNKKQLHFQIDPEGEHNEVYWKSAFPDAIKWLFNI